MNAYVRLNSFGKKCILKITHTHIHARAHSQDHKGTVLHSALEEYEGYVDILRVLVQNGADVNAKTEDNRTALCLTTSRNSSQSKFLIKNGAEVHHADEWGRTALHGAGRSGWSEIVRMLIQSGADVNAVDIRNLIIGSHNHFDLFAIKVRRINLRC